MNIDRSISLILFMLLLLATNIIDYVSNSCCGIIARGFAVVGFGKKRGPNSSEK